MKFKNRHHYSPVDQLNRENERDLWTPILAIPTVLLVLVLIIANLIRYSEVIDKFCSKHPVLVGWSLVLISLVGIIALVKRLS